MKTVTLLLKGLENIISYRLQRIASGKSLAAVIGVIIRDLAISIINAVVLGLILFAVVNVISVIIISVLLIVLAVIILICHNRIRIKTLKGIVSREGFLQRVEVGVNP